MTSSSPKKHATAEQLWHAEYGPWAVVTGASGGIGAGIARELARRRLNVVLAARSETGLRGISRELEETYGVETRSLAGDLGDPDALSKLKAATADLDIGLFVANAGFGTSGPFIDGDLETELEMIDLNVRALAEQTHYFANRLRSRRRGGIILLSSIVSWQGVPGAANYAATKSYVQSLAEALGRELKPYGIDVVASAPAQVATGFAARADMQADGANPAIVAKNTVAALGRKSTVYPHFMSWFLSTALSFLPRPLRVTILSGVMSGMTRHQTASAPRS